jgi:hypothetical protein
MSTVLIRADLRCYHCGHTSARVQVERGRPLAEARLLDPSGLEESQPVGRPLRCSRCQGPLFLDPGEVVRSYPAFAEPLLPLRRGRPPGLTRKELPHGRVPHVGAEVASA